MTEFVVMFTEPADRFIEFFSEAGHPLVELVDAVLRNQANAGLRKRQRNPFPVRDCSAPNGRYRFEGRVTRIKQLLTRRQKLTFGPKRVGGLILLRTAERLTEPSQLKLNLAATIVKRRRSLAADEACEPSSSNTLVMLNLL